MTKKFVIAGNHDQAMAWIKSDITKQATIDGRWRSISDYIIVSGIDNIKGFSNPHGVFVGTWRSRTDIVQIVECLLMSSIHVNKDLGKIWGEVKPKTKLTPVNGGWINKNLMIEQAAKELADAIDAQVIQVMKERA